MIEPLRRTLDAMPAPTVVIAVGTDALSGGLIGGGYTGGTGISEIVPVDVWIPGAPASPFSVLHGILLAVGRLPLPELGSVR
jgi:Ni,Fe-hydrogenase III small subunit